jgi:hypothetical protein
VTGCTKLTASAQVVTTGVLLALADGGKRRVSVSMYLKGRAFIGAAILLNRHAESDDIEYVVLHLFCQGMEVVLKGLLLFKNYDKYTGRLKNSFGHNLSKLAAEASLAYGLNPMRGAFDSEIRTLSDFYSKHRLRYGTVSDMFIDPHTISHEKVFRRLAATIRLAERELRRAQIT